jgi:hypothetical protein
MAPPPPVPRPASSPALAGLRRCTARITIYNCRISVPESAGYVITAISAGDNGDSQLPGSVVVPGSSGRLDIQLGDDYGQELTGYPVSAITSP